VDANHKKGIYLKFCGEMRNAPYYFSRSELIFDFYCTKPDQVLSVATQDKAGIKDAIAYAWHGEAGQWDVVESINDGVVDAIKAVKSPALLPLIDKPASRERLISFSVGPAAFTRDWHKPYRSKSFQVSQGNEMPCGTLVRLREEQQSEIEAILQRFATLETTILKTRCAEPPIFRDLVGKSIQLGMQEDSEGIYSSNLIADGKPAFGAQIFIGDSSEQHARRVLEQFQGEIKPNRAVVWYRAGETIAHVDMKERSFASAYADPRDFSETNR
jgi:hypothetical protein